MRFSFLALAALITIAVPASAQTHLADSSGVYLSLGAISSYSASGSVGYRQLNGLDYGVRLGISQSTRTGQPSASTGASFEIGPQVGYTAPLGKGTLGRVSSAVLYASGGFTQANSDAPYRSLSYQSLSGNVTATVSRPVRLLGSLRVQPTVGVYAEARHLLSLEFDQPQESEIDRTRFSAGLHLGLPISLRVLGQDATLSPYVQIPVADGFLPQNVYAGGGLRINF